MIPTSLLGRDCFRGRRHRRHGHNVFGPRRRREGHLERRERVAFDAQQEASVAAERVDEGRLGVRRRDLGRGQGFGQRGQQLLRRRRAAEFPREHVERRDESAKLSARRAAPRDRSERRTSYATVDDNGVITAASACKQDATEPCETFSIKVVAGWAGCDPDMAFTAPCEAAEQFNVITNTAIADGVITDA